MFSHLRQLVPVAPSPNASIQLPMHRDLLNCSTQMGHLTLEVQRLKQQMAKVDMLV
jgi:hypothetical protein